MCLVIPAWDCNIVFLKRQDLLSITINVTVTDSSSSDYNGMGGCRHSSSSIVVSVTVG